MKYFLAIRVLTEDVSADIPGYDRYVRGKSCSLNNDGGTYQLINSL